MLLTGKVRVSEPQGSETYVMLDLADGQAIARAPSNITFTPGQTVRFAAPADTLRIYDTRSGRLIK